MVDFAMQAERLKWLGGVRIWNKRYHNTPPGTKYGGRPTILGNPFEVGKHGARGECCDMHQSWLITGRWRHIKDVDCPAATETLRAKVLEMIPSLRGQDLECWCWPNRCHMEVIAHMANGGRDLWAQVVTPQLSLSRL